MRDPDRIERLLNQLREVWQQQPDLRLGQLLVLLARPQQPCPELFSLEDDQLAQRVVDFAETLHKANHQLRYVKRHWNESRSENRAWGKSWWYFEIDPLDNVLRQIECYETGPTHGYDAQHHEDEFGGLSQVPLENVRADYQSIALAEFQRLWQQCSNRG